MVSERHRDLIEREKMDREAGQKFETWRTDELRSLCEVTYGRSFRRWLKGEMVELLRRRFPVDDEQHPSPPTGYGQTECDLLHPAAAVPSKGSTETLHTGVPEIQNTTPAPTGRMQRLISLVHAGTQEIIRLHRRIIVLHRQTSDHAANLNNARSQNSVLVAQVQQLTGQLIQADAALEVLHRERTELTFELQVANNLLRSTIQDRDNLTDQLLASTTGRDVAIQECSRITIELRDSKAINQILSRENTEFRDYNDTLRFELEDERARSAQTRDTLQNLFLN